MSTDLVPAVWRGPGDGELLGGRILRPGDQALVTQRDLDSAHWQRVKPEKPAPAAQPDKTTDDRSDS